MCKCVFNGAVPNRKGIAPKEFRALLKDHMARLKMDETFATRYLNEQALTVSEVAFLLGFSSGAAFHRAFRRWTGASPAAYREKLWHA